MITGEPGDWAAWPCAATNIQCLKAVVLIGLPATTATESLGTPELEPPHPATAAAMTTKKAPSARMDRRDFIGPGR